MQAARRCGEDPEGRGGALNRPFKDLLPNGRWEKHQQTKQQFAAGGLILAKLCGQFLLAAGKIVGSIFYPWVNMRNTWLDIFPPTFFLSGTHFSSQPNGNQKGKSKVSLSHGLVLSTLIVYERLPLFTDDYSEGRAQIWFG